MIRLGLFIFILSLCACLEKKDSPPEPKICPVTVHGNSYMIPIPNQLRCLVSVVNDSTSRPPLDPPAEDVCADGWLAAYVSVQVGATDYQYIRCFDPGLAPPRPTANGCPIGYSVTEYEGPENPSRDPGYRCVSGGSYYTGYSEIGLPNESGNCSSGYVKVKSFDPPFVFVGPSTMPVDCTM